MLLIKKNNGGGSAILIKFWKNVHIKAVLSFIKHSMIINTKSMHHLITQEYKLIHIRQEHTFKFASIHNIKQYAVRGPQILDQQSSLL